MNELQIMPNPQNVPNTVEDSYQLQNVNIAAVQTGLDTTEPYDNGAGIITVPMGGIVEVNGVMFKIASDVTVVKPDAGTACWLEVITSPDNQTASLGAVARPGFGAQRSRAAIL